MASSSRATTSSDGPRYQGYPYVNLPAFGVPTIDSQTASRYANLPRRPLGIAVRVQEGRNGTQNNQDNPKSQDSDDEPVLYIDMPADGESDMYVREEDSPTQDQRIPVQPLRSKDEDEQVVYIDLPECSGSGVSDRRPEDGPSTNNIVVQETIFYDQFKNRRIDVLPQMSGINSPMGSGSTMSPAERPATLSLWSPGSSDATRPAPTPGPPYLLPQNSDGRPYRNSPAAEDFRLSPLPVSDYPDPPPAYTEIDFRSPERQENAIQHASTETNRPPESPPRTTVILHPTGRVHSNRKMMTCNHCQVTVNSLVVRQVTYETHLVACICFCFAMIPLIPVIYCCDICRSDVHYCPICNNQINKEFKLC